MSALARGRGAGALEAAALSRSEAVGPERAAVELVEAVAEAREGGRPRYGGLGPEDLAGLEPVAAGGLYEGLLAHHSAARRKGLGAWYTPPGLAGHLVRGALDGLPDEDGLRILDPAAGAGAFLVEAARRLRERLGSPVRAAQALWALDRDPGALGVCRAVLAAEGYAVPADRFVCVDALLEPWPVERLHAVVGNPPYVNIVRLPAAERAELARRYATFRNKCDLYGLFVEAAARRLRPGGRLALLVSDSFLGTSSFAPLRELLFGGGALRTLSVDRVTGRAFGAAVRPVAVIAEHVPAQSARAEAGLAAAGGRAPARTPTVRFGRVDPAGRPGPSVRVDAATLSRRARLSAAIPDDPEALARVETMAAAGIPLGELVEVALGVKTADDRRFLREGPRPAAPGAWVPALRGRDVARWRAGADLWLDYRPQVLRSVHGARPRDPAHFERPAKLLLRETSGADLIAAFDAEGRYPLDTVHAVHLRDDRPPACSLWYVLAVLNAAPTRFWYGLHHPGSHVKAGEVRALPVPPPGPRDRSAAAPAIADAAAWIADAAARNVSGGPPAPSGFPPLPAACLRPEARHAVLDLLARFLSGPVEGAAREAAVHLVDAVVAAGYGLAGWQPPAGR